MKRRTFLQLSLGSFALPTLFSSAGLYGAEKFSPVIRFGVFTDAHYTPKGSLSQSLDKVRAAVKVFNEQRCNFAIELGDFKNDGADRQETLGYLDTIEEAFQAFNGAKYHVLGNHEMDKLSKKDVLSHTTNTGRANGKAYYAFIRNGVKFIVLDANYNLDGSDYDNDNFKWTEAMIPAGQLRWLEQQLRSRHPAVIFVHQLLDRFATPEGKYDHYVRNADEVVAILEKRKNVLAVFQGHQHNDRHSFRNGIHYCTLNALRHGDYPEHNAFAIVEIDRRCNMNIDGYVDCIDVALPRNAAG
ncbi:alkaline phosphatase [Planctomycetales bacterium]|nr:alkaline phosphatase [Planctomycetales bacterium]